MPITREQPFLFRLKLLAAPALLFLIIMALTFGLASIASILYIADVDQSTYQACIRVINVLDSKMEKRTNALLQLANAFNILDDVSETEFAGQSRFVMQEAPEILAIVHARGRQVVWNESRGGLGLEDVKSILALPQSLVAIGKADNRQRKYTVSEMIPIPGQGDGFIMAVPYAKGETSGVVIGVFLQDKLLNELLFPDMRGNFDVELAQGASGSDRLAPPPLRPAETKWAWKSPTRELRDTFPVGDQRWSIRVEQTNASLYSNPTWFIGGSLLTLGAILAIFSSLFLYHQQWRAAIYQTEYMLTSSRLVSTGLSLAQIQENLDLILNNVDEGIILYNEEMEPIQANAVFKKTFLKDPTRLGLDITADHHRMMSAQFQNESQYWALLNGLRENPERPLSDEIEARRATGEGSPRHFQRRATAVLGPDRSMRGFLVIYQDITATRSVERLKEDFLSSVTHDLRTPLASIKGFAETMLRDPDMDPKTREEFAQIIRAEARRLEEMIEDLLDLRRMEDGLTDLSPSTYNLKALVEEIVRGMRPILDLSELKVDLVWVGLSGQMLLGDAAKMGRALRNIIGNSAKYSPPGGTIWIKGRESEDRVELEITDEGPGIPQGDLPHVFEKFYRGAKVVRRTKGTGLGLAIVKHIIDGHGGVVTANNAEGKGATIRIILPREMDLHRTPVPVAPDREKGRHAAHAV